MLSGNAISAVAALFIVAMVWLRTRMHYARRLPAGRSLTAAGALYFAALVTLLVAGWFAAPRVTHELAASLPVAPAFARVMWFLAAYYLFIPVHRILRARGLAVFRADRSPEGGMA
jgi:hypothetical protein